MIPSDSNDDSILKFEKWSGGKTQDGSIPPSCKCHALVLESMDRKFIHFMVPEKSRTN
jgi:hypothetical protein